MSTNTTEYTVRDEDGDEVTINYISRSCKCSTNNCNEDTIELYEPGDDTPYSQNIFRGEVSSLIKGLLDCSYKVDAATK